MGNVISYLRHSCKYCRGSWAWSVYTSQKKAILHVHPLLHCTQSSFNLLRVMSSGSQYNQPFSFSVHQHYAKLITNLFRSFPSVSMYNLLYSLTYKRRPRFILISAWCTSFPSSSLYFLKSLSDSTTKLRTTTRTFPYFTAVAFNQFL